MDKISRDLVDEALANAKEREAPGSAGLDATSKRLVDEALSQAQSQVALEGSEPAKHDPDADKWSFTRHAVDAALYGKGTSAEQEKFKAAWEKENPNEAATANFIGKSVPAVALSTAAGRALLALGEVAGLPTVASFLTGAGGSNLLSRGASLATAGAGQGAISAGYGRAMGSDESIPGGAAAGAIAGPALHAAASPLLSNIGPGLKQVAKNYMQATGVPLRLGQLGSAAPPIVRAMSKLFGMGKRDIPVLTKGLMARTGSSSPVATRGALSDARDDIRSSLSNWGFDKKDAAGNYLVADADVAKQLQQLAPMTRGSQAQTVQQAQQQWTTTGKIERMLNNSSPEAQANGLIEPKAVQAEIQNTRGPQYPGGVPADVNALGQGADIFARPATVGPTLAHASALGTAGAAATGLMAEHAVPLLEHTLGVPGGAAVLGAVGSAAYGGVGAAMNSPAYLRMLLGKGYVANPLIPAAQQQFGNAVGANMRLTTPASAGELLPTVNAAAEKYGLDPQLMARQIDQESGFKNLRPNRAGAAGVAQFIPETARKYGVDVTDPASSIDGMGRYMKDLHGMFKGNTGLALAGYNMGENGLQAALAGKRSIPSETREYVKNITGRPLDDWLADYRKGVQVAPGPTSSGFSSVLATSPSNDLTGSQ